MLMNPQTQPPVTPARFDAGGIQLDWPATVSPAIGSKRAAS
jgi:hypothetical protein